MSSPAAFQRCIDPVCAATFEINESLLACRRCSGLLDVAYDWDRLPVPASPSVFDARRGSFAPPDFSGVWRFRELLPFFGDVERIFTIGEGRTILQRADGLAGVLGMPGGTLELQYEGLNPSGSFKDNGMTTALTHAQMAGAKRLGCASTGNTSASMAMYAALAELPSVVLVGGGRITPGKLAQALSHGARVLEVEGAFDGCLRALEELSRLPEIGLYLMNSLNPFRLEGQKAIIYRVLEARAWRVPDWIIVPGGNLGNTAAFGKALVELKSLGLIECLPRIAVIVAEGANTLYRVHEEMDIRWSREGFPADKVAGLYAAFDETGYEAQTAASAIAIGRPVNLPKALRALEATRGVVRKASDGEIFRGRGLVARHGFGCESAGGATIAGLRLLLEEGTIVPGQEVVCILTGHELKDATATIDGHAGAGGSLGNRPMRVKGDIVSIRTALRASN